MFTPRVWTSQPAQARAGIFRQRRVEGILYGADASTEGRPVIRVGTIIPSYTPYGVGWQTSGAATNMVRAGLVNPFVLGTHNLTYICAFRVVSATVSTVISGFGAEGGSAGNTLGLMRLGGTNTGTINFLLQDGSGGLPVNLTTTDFDVDDGGLHTVVASCDLATSGAIAIYADGKSVATATRAAMSGSTTFASICAGGTRRGGTDSPTAGTFQIFLVAPIYAKLTNEEARELSRNPWQLFQPLPAEDYFGIPTAAAGTFMKLAGTRFSLAGNSGLAA